MRKDKTVSIEAVFFRLKEKVMKFTKANITMLALSGLVAALVVWASNNVDVVEDYIG